MASGRGGFPAPTLRLQSVSNYTGGLNLRANAFQVEANESPDMMDVSVEIGGGFVQRQAVQPYAQIINTSFGTFIAYNIFSYQTPTVQQVVAVVAGGANSGIYFTTGGAWTHAATYTGGAPSNYTSGVVFGNNLYILNGSLVAPSRWNGTTNTILTQNFNETIGTEGAADGNMPFARYGCAHMSRVFIAYTTESGTDFPNRIRWSHAGFAEDWRQEDFIDIDVGHDGDYITGLVEFKDRLYIFKNNSIHVLTGYGTENFAVTPLTQGIGAVGQKAICVTEVGLFFFSWPQGVYLDRGNGPYPIFDKLYPLTRDNFIPSAFRHLIAMGWVNKNLWMSVPYGTSTVNSRTYVYNPWIWRNRYLRFLQGPWYPYSLGINAFATVDPPGAQTLYLAASSTLSFVGQLEQNSSTDNWGSGATNINSFFKSRFEDLGQSAVVKRWRRPEMAIRAEGGGSALVEVYRDYDPTVVHRTFQLAPTAATLGMLWDIGVPVPSASIVGTAGTTTYTYVVTALLGSQEFGPSAQAQVTNGNATLSGTNFNTISWAAITQATSYNVYGRVAGSLKLIANVTTTSYNDQGAALGTQTPPASSPAGKWDDGTGTVGSKWSIPTTVGAEEITKGGYMGSARAVQLAFYAPAGQSWGVDSITYKFIPKRVHG